MKAIDLFAGLGGMSEGARLAGVDVVWAANHWDVAVRAHQMNHPAAQHVCQDLRQADWTRLPRFDLLLAAPACQGNSTASQPRRRAHHDALRATAWAVVDCADVTEPRALVVENVLSLRRWRLYPLWCAALERLGYRLTDIEVTATDYGVPQRRTRLFVVGTRKGFFRLRSRVTSEPAFGPCVENDVGGWSSVASTPPGARERMVGAVRRHGPRVLVQHVTGHRGVPLYEPIRTITGQRQWVLVEGDRFRYLTPRELARGQGFPDTYRLDGLSFSDAVLAIGNAVVPPVGAAVVRAVAEVA